jgi:hypothetical protein
MVFINTSFANNRDLLLIIFYYLMSDMDPTGLRRLLHHRGKNLCIYRKKNPAVRLGEEKPYKPPQ